MPSIIVVRATSTASEKNWLFPTLNNQTLCGGFQCRQENIKLAVLLCYLVQLKLQFAFSLRSLLQETKQRVSIILSKVSFMSNENTQSYGSEIDTERNRWDVRLFTGSRSKWCRSPISTTGDALGELPSSSFDSVIGDGGWGGETYTTFNFASCTSFPSSLLNCTH